jgi:hypothetical protein
MHSPVGPSLTHHRTMMTPVSGCEYRSENDQRGQRKGPKAEVLTKRSERPL